MTKARAVISASMAERGRPEMWANEQESAALSGLTPDRFSIDLEKLEAAGFPPKSPWNSLRFIPSIIDFWRREQERTSSGSGPDEVRAAERAKENWDHEPRRRKPK